VFKTGLIVILMAFSGCAHSLPKQNSSEKRSGKISVIVPLDIPKSRNLGVDSITVNISGPVSDTLDMTFSSDSASASVLFQDLIQGIYSIRITAFNKSGKVIATGYGEAAVRSGHKTIVDIEMLIATGELEVRTTWKHPDPVQENSLISEYLFNGNANDISGHNLHGTVYGAQLTTDRFGNPNSAYLFNGDDYISAPHSDSYNSDTLSFSVWIMMLDYNYWPRIFWKGKIPAEGNASTFDLYFQTQFNELRFDVTDLLTNNWQFTAVSAKIQTGTWYHIAGTYDGKKQILYFNGSPVDTLTKDFEVLDNYDPLLIGTGENYRYFKGKIDDLRFYNRVLSEKEILDLYLENR